MPDEGLSPLNPCEYRVLSPVRMPIPLLRHIIKIITSPSPI